jgi:hypothetical protein
MPLPSLPADKANHAVYGAIAAAVAVPVGAYFGFPREISALAGSIGVGILKELADLASNWLAARAGQPAPNTVDLWDFVATAAGALPVAGVDGLGNIAR